MPVTYRHESMSVLYEYLRYDVSNCFSIYVKLSKGKYSLDVWGASGGTNDDTKYGATGYSYGIVNIYVYRIKRYL